MTEFDKRAAPASGLNVEVSAPSVPLEKAQIGRAEDSPANLDSLKSKSELPSLASVASPSRDAVKEQAPEIQVVEGKAPREQSTREAATSSKDTLESGTTNSQEKDFQEKFQEKTAESRAVSKLKNHLESLRGEGGILSDRDAEQARPLFQEIERITRESGRLAPSAIEGIVEEFIPPSKQEEFAAILSGQQSEAAALRLHSLLQEEPVALDALHACAVKENLLSGTNLVQAYSERFGVDPFQTLRENLRPSEYAALVARAEDPLGVLARELHDAGIHPRGDHASLFSTLSQYPTELLTILPARFAALYGIPLATYLERRIDPTVAADVALLIARRPEAPLASAYQHIKALDQLETNLATPLLRTSSQHQALQQQASNAVREVDVIFSGTALEDDDEARIKNFTEIMAANDQARRAIRSVRAHRLSFAEQVGYATGIAVGLVIILIFIRSDKSISESLAAGAVSFWFSEIVARNVAGGSSKKARREADRVKRAIPEVFRGRDEK